MNNIDQFDETNETAYRRASKRQARYKSELTNSRRQNRGNHHYKQIVNVLCGMVGKSFNSIYSHLLNKVPVKHHQTIELAIRNCVEKDIHVQPDGSFYIIGYRYSERKLIPLEESFCRFYIHPKTGLMLRINGQTSRQRREERRKHFDIEKRATLIELGKYHVIKKINGSWVEIKIDREHHETANKIFKKFSTQHWTDTNPYLYEVTKLPDGHWNYTNISVPVSRKSLNSKQLTERGLKNAVIF